MRRSQLLVSALVAIGAACATQQIKRPGPDSPRQDFIRRGEFLFWSEDALAGAGGRHCAGCHENHVPFDDWSLARNYYDLPKLVDNCLYDRTKHAKGPFSELESRALREFVVYNYVLKGVIADEDPEGIRRLGEGMEKFLHGEYETALSEIRAARDLVKTEQNRVQSFALEGCIQLFMLNDREAREAFASALKINPDVRIDGYVFSPKVLRVLESTRAEVVPASTPLTTP